MNINEIQGRLRELFPKANLSKQRLEGYATKLQSKLTEESTTEELDGLIKDLNDLVDFEQIAKDDDRLRTLSKPKTTEMKPTSEEPKDDTPEWAKVLQAEIQSLKSEKLQDSIKSTVHERLKDVPKEILEYVKLPSSLDEVDEFVDKFSNSFKDAKIQTRASSFGGDNPKSGDKQKEPAVKSATLEEVKELGLKF